MKNRKGFSPVIALVAVLAVLLLANYLASMMPQPPNAEDNSIKKFASYAELEEFISKNSQGYSYGPTLRIMEDAQAPPIGPSAASAKSEVSDGTGTPAYSGTNIQVEGVDEADIVKTDGRYIYVVSGDKAKVVILEAFPPEAAKIVSEINVSGNGNVEEIFVNGDRLVVLLRENPMRLGGADPVDGGNTGTVAEKCGMSILPPAFRYSPRTGVDVYDIADRASPVLANNISIDGNYFNSRMIGDVVYVIATNQAYYVKGEPIPLPAIRTATTGGAGPASTSFPEIYYFDAPDMSYVFSTVAALNIMDDDSAGLSSKILLTGATSNMYVSLDSIYLTYSKYTNIFESDTFIETVVMPLLPVNWQNEIGKIQANSNLNQPEKLDKIQKIVEDFVRTLSPEQAREFETQAMAKIAEVQKKLSREREKTVVQKLSIGDGKVEYKTSGEVPGTILNQFSMDEHKGHFRIATTITSAGEMGPVTSRIEPAGITADEQKRLEESTEPATTIASVVPPRPTSGPSNNVYVLDGDMKLVGRLEDLAPGERIYSMRFLGDKGYMVTFRQVDPLFVIDLSQPAEPKVLGFLKIPGVSDYLHPYDDTHVIGVGRDASEEGRILGMKLSLFDVSNVSSPREVSKYIIGQRGTDSEALRDHKAFLFSREKSILVLPVSELYEFFGGQEMGTPWISHYSQGAYVFNLDLASGFVLKGKIAHTGNETSYDWDANVRRSLFIDDILYTVSNRKVMANRLSDMSEAGEVALPRNMADEAGMGVVIR